MSSPPEPKPTRYNHLAIASAFPRWHLAERDLYDGYCDENDDDSGYQDWLAQIEFWIEPDRDLDFDYPILHAAFDHSGIAHYWLPIDGWQVKEDQ